MNLHLVAARFVSEKCDCAMLGAGPASILFYPWQTFGCPSFRSFQKLSFWDASRRLGSVEREKIGGVNASGAQLSNGRKAEAASVNMVMQSWASPLTLPANYLKKAGL
jgi:hypothetical protein